jgi:hypothetical protein
MHRSLGKGRHINPKSIVETEEKSDTRWRDVLRANRTVATCIFNPRETQASFPDAIW